MAQWYISSRQSYISVISNVNSNRLYSKQSWLDLLLCQHCNKETWYNCRQTCTCQHLMTKPFPQDLAMRKIFQKIENSSKAKQDRKCLMSIFSYFVACHYQEFIFTGEMGHKTVSPFSFIIFLVFPFFLRYQVRSHLTTCKETHLQSSLYQILKSVILVVNESLTLNFVKCHA